MTAKCLNLKTSCTHIFALCMLFAILAHNQVAYAAEPHFTDVGPNHWAYIYVEQAAEMGFVSGVSETTFAPDEAVTNAQFMTMITRAFYAHSANAAVELADGGEWWMPYAETAYIKGILKGTAVLIPRDSESAQWDSSINAGISRYDMAQIICNVMKAETTKTPDAAAIESAKQAIADWGEIPVNYQEAVATCYAAGCISGIDSSGTFAGTALMSRAQAATVMCRLMG